jgi:nucleoside-diphosphate-sugar epimerase
LKVLVIGNSGFIGRPLADALLSEGHEVLGMDVRPPAEKPPYACVAGDIRSKEDIRRAAEGTDLIINLAAVHKDFGVSTEAYFAVNDVGTHNVVVASSELGIERVFFFSSTAVYGPAVKVTEKTPVAPAVVYGESKVAGERRVATWAAENPGRHAVILRPTVVFGPRNFGNMCNLIQTIAARRFVMVGNGENIKSVAYVGNVVAAAMFLIRQMRPGLVVYNYSDYPQMTARELVGQICLALERRAPRFHLPLGPVLAAAQAVDVVGRWTGYDFPITANRIRKLNTSTAIISDEIRNLGFRQVASIEESIGATVDWYRAYRRTASA